LPSYLSDRHNFQNPWRLHTKKKKTFQVQKPLFCALRIQGAGAPISASLQFADDLFDRDVVAGLHGMNIAGNQLLPLQAR
jgi:hypothetical protein